MDYSEALAYVASLEHRGWRLGLDRMEEFVRRAGLGGAIGRPDLFEPGQTPVRGTAPLYIHVAGTNGKGSVTAYLQFVLREAGYRVGGFFSPFVYDIRERIQLDGEMISEQDFVRLIERLRPVAETLEGTELGGVTEFEFKTAMGFAYWEDKGCDWVALEVGLGGRLDATNVLTPACSVITSIGMDHMEFLGETLGAIAGEKAGILKPGVPAVAGRLPDEAMAAVRDRAKRLGCPLWVLGEDFEVERGPLTVRTPGGIYRDLPQPIPGPHQPDNVAVAVAALEAAGAPLSEEIVRRGLTNVFVPGRFERRRVAGIDVILDGAHNEEAMDRLIQTLREESVEDPVVVFGMLTGHDPGPLCARVDEIAGEVHLSPIDFRRTADPNDLFGRFERASAEVHADAASAITAALAAAKGRTVLVTGSFYLVGEVGRYLGPLTLGTSDSTESCTSASRGNNPRERRERREDD